MAGPFNALVRGVSVVSIGTGEVLDVVASLVVLGAAVSIMTWYWLNFGHRRSPTFSRLQNVRGGVLLGKSLMNGGYWALQPVGRALCTVGVRPNTITWFGLALALVAGGALVAGYPGVAGFFFLCSVLCDALDGLVARMGRRQSASGAVFDAISDRLEEIVAFSAIAIATRQSSLMVALCVGALVATLMNSYVSAKAEAARVPVPNGRMRRGERSAWVIAGLVATPLLALSNPPWHVYLPALTMLVLLVVVSIGTTISVTARALALLRQVRSAAESPTAAVCPNPTTEGGADSDSARHLVGLFLDPHKQP